MIQGIIFDLDGTLIDSEPLWKEAEIAVYATQGLHLSVEDCRKTTGLPSLEAVKFWYDKIEEPSKEVGLLSQEISQQVIKLIKEKGELKPGVFGLLEFLKTKHIPLGIASASSMANIKAVLDKFNLSGYFNLIYSGDFEVHGKPHPGVYISACEKLKINPLYSIAIEDSFNGILAGKSARMKVVALLDEGQIYDVQYGFADLKLESLREFDQSKYEFLESLLNE